MFILNTTVNVEEWAIHIQWSCCIVDVVNGEDKFYKVKNFIKNDFKYNNLDSENIDHILIPF